MKKSLILIAIALMVLVPVFAVEETEAEETPAVTRGTATTTIVDTRIKLEPQYLYGITDAEIEGTETSISNVSEIQLSRNTGSNTLSSATKYVSYIFKEYEDVTLYISIDGDMIGWDKTNDKADTSITTKIPLDITVEATDDHYDEDVLGNAKDYTTKTTLVEIDSTNDANTEKKIVTYEGTKLVSDVRWCSAKLTVEPQNNLDGVQMGYYLATITLTAKSK